MYINTRNINYIKATCFGYKSAIIRPIQNMYKIQYKCALYGVTDIVG